MSEVSSQYLGYLREAASFLQSNWGDSPRVAFVLGSGWGDFVNTLQDRDTIPYANLPGFPLSTVVGHAGQLTVASSQGDPFCALQGRVHFYEGAEMGKIVFPVRALALWGVDYFVITNAAGAINPLFCPGDLMLISDHINQLGDNPLTGENLDELGPRFPDMSSAYSRLLLEAARTVAASRGITVQEGVYLATKGPSYETPSEIEMFRKMGADAVGMSTVPEVIALNHMSRRVLGISCITNMAAGMVAERMDHSDVLRVTERAQKAFSAILLGLLEWINREHLDE